MNRDYKTLSSELMRRGLSIDDLDNLDVHSKKSNEAIESARRYKDKEFEILSKAAYDLYTKYPEKKTMYENCQPKTRRDMSLVMRYSIYSMLLNDPDYANERMLFWFRTILNAFEFGKTFIEDAYRFVQTHVQKTIGGNPAISLNKKVDDAIHVFNS